MDSKDRIHSRVLGAIDLSKIKVDGGGRSMSFKGKTANGKEYFIKAFNKPKWPVIITDPKLRKQREEECAVFIAKQYALYQRTSRAQKNHSELVQFYDFVEPDTAGPESSGLYHVVYEYVNEVGSGNIEREGIHSRAYVIADAAAGLAHLHEAGVVHLDVKPANVLLYNGQDTRSNARSAHTLRAKLMDYDGGCALDHPPPVKYGLLDFDDAYASPEFMRYRRGDSTVELNPSMDIFSLSLTAAKIIVGSLPLEPAETLADGADPATFLSLDKITHQQAPLRELILRGLSLDSGERPTAADFHEGFANWLGRRQTTVNSRQTKSGSWFSIRTPEEPETIPPPIPVIPERKTAPIPRPKPAVASPTTTDVKTPPKPADEKRAKPPYPPKNPTPVRRRRGTPKLVLGRSTKPK